MALVRAVCPILTLWVALALLGSTVSATPSAGTADSKAKNASSPPNPLVAGQTVGAWSMEHQYEHVWGKKAQVDATTKKHSYRKQNSTRACLQEGGLAFGGMSRIEKPAKGGKSKGKDNKKKRGINDFVYWSNLTIWMRSGGGCGGIKAWNGTGAGTDESKLKDKADRGNSFKLVEVEATVVAPGTGRLPKLEKGSGKPPGPSVGHSMNKLPFTAFFGFANKSKVEFSLKDKKLKNGAQAVFDPVRAGTWTVFKDLVAKNTGKRSAALTLMVDGMDKDAFKLDESIRHFVLKAGESKPIQINFHPQRTRGANYLGAALYVVSSDSKDHRVFYVYSRALPNIKAIVLSTGKLIPPYNYKKIEYTSNATWNADAVSAEVDVTPGFTPTIAVKGATTLPNTMSKPVKFPAPKFKPVFDPACEKASSGSASASATSAASTSTSASGASGNCTNPNAVWVEKSQVELEIVVGGLKVGPGPDAELEALKAGKEPDESSSASAKTTITIKVIKPKTLVPYDKFAKKYPDKKFSAGASSSGEASGAASSASGAAASAFLEFEEDVEERSGGRQAEVPGGVNSDVLLEEDKEQPVRQYSGESYVARELFKAMKHRSLTASEMQWLYHLAKAQQHTPLARAFSQRYSHVGSNTDDGVDRLSNEELDQLITATNIYNFRLNKETLEQRERAVETMSKRPLRRGDWVQDPRTGAYAFQADVDTFRFAAPAPAAGGAAAKPTAAKGKLRSAAEVHAKSIKVNSFVIFGGYGGKGQASMTNKLRLLHILPPKELMKRHLTHDESKKLSNFSNGNSSLKFDVRWEYPLIKGRKPKPRAYHSATQVGPFFIVFGGMGKTGFFNDLWVLDFRVLTEANVPGNGGKPASFLEFGSAHGLGMSSVKSPSIWRELSPLGQRPDPIARAMSTIITTPDNFTYVVIYGGVGRQGTRQDPIALYTGCTEYSNHWANVSCGKLPSPAGAPVDPKWNKTSKAVARFLWVPMNITNPTTNTTPKAKLPPGPRHSGALLRYFAKPNEAVLVGGYGFEKFFNWTAKRHQDEVYEHWDVAWKHGSPYRTNPTWNVTKKTPIKKIMKMSAGAHLTCKGLVRAVNKIILYPQATQFDNMLLTCEWKPLDLAAKIKGGDTPIMSFASATFTDGRTLVLGGQKMSNREVFANPLRRSECEKYPFGSPKWVDCDYEEFKKTHKKGKLKPKYANVDKTSYPMPYLKGARQVLLGEEKSTFATKVDGGAAPPAVAKPKAGGAASAASAASGASASASVSSG